MAKAFVTLVIFGVFAAVLVNGFDEEAAWIEVMYTLSECKEEVGAQESDIKEIVEKKPSSTMEGKCLRACLLKKYNLMDNNGKFVKDVAVKHAQIYTDGSEDRMKIAHEVIDACIDIEVADDHCEAAEQYDLCLNKQTEENNI